MPPPKTYRYPACRYRVSATTVLTSRPMAPVTGSAKLKNQCPPVAQLMYSRYSPMAAKSTGTKMTGFGRRNHSGRMMST